MRFLTLLFLFIFSFACDTSSINNAYQDYYSNQQKYISAILNNDKKAQITYLKELIKCGNFLNYDVNDYKKELKKLSASLKKERPKLPRVRIYQTHPLKMKIPSIYVKYYTKKNNKTISKIIEIPNALILKSIQKNLKNGIKLNIYQYKKSVIVSYSSTDKFKLKYKIKNHILFTTLITPKKIPPIVIKKRPKIIVIDPGHGGKDGGGIGLKKTKEKHIVLQISKKLKRILQKKGYKVYLTREKDTFVKLTDRTHFANEKKADLFISIHCNVAPKHITKPHGIETYFLSPTRNERAIRVAKLENESIQGLKSLDQNVILNFLNRERMVESNKLAIDVQQNILSSLRRYYSKIRDGGVRPAPFWVLVGTQMPAILIETGYLTNPIEERRLSNSHYQQKLAEGIAKGVEAYFKKNR